MPNKTKDLTPATPFDDPSPGLAPPEDFLDGDTDEINPPEALTPGSPNYFDEPEEGDDEENDAENLPDDEEDPTVGEEVQRLNAPRNKASSPASRPRGRPRKVVDLDGEGGEPVVKRKRGRPRIHPEVRLARGEDRGAKSFPPPACFHFRDDNKEIKKRPQGFFEYWKEVWDDPALRDRIMVYVYRIWPVLVEHRRQLDKFTDPISYDDLQLRYGAGDYHIKMNDAGMKYKTVAICTAKGFRDEANHPPIYDIDALDTRDPLNQSFIERLRVRGIRVPGDPGYFGTSEKEQKEEDEMANVEIMNKFADTLERATNRTIAIVEKVSEEKEKEKAVQPPTTEEKLNEAAGMTGIGVLAEAVKSQSAMTMTLLQQMITSRGGDGEKAAPPPTIVDQMNAMGTMMDAINKLIPKQPPAPSTDPALAQILSKLTQVLEDRHSTANVDLATREVMRPKSLVEQVKEMTEVKEMMREALGLEENSGSSGFVEHLPTIIQGLALLGSVVVSGLHNLAVLKTGTGAPMAPPSPEQILTQEQREAVHNAGFTPAQPQPQPGQPQGDDMNINPMARYHEFLGKLKPSLLKAFNENLPGHEYAELLVELGDNGLFGEGSSGRQIYDTLLESGQVSVDMLVKTYPPIWEVVNKTPKKWDKFLSDFFNADAIFAQMQEQEETAAAGQAPVIPATPIREE